jgi:hypothetical protein
MELFTATWKLKKFFWKLEIFDVYTTGDRAHIDTLFKFLPHTRQHECVDILYCCNDPCLRGHVAMVGRTQNTVHSTSHHCHVSHMHGLLQQWTISMHPCWRVCTWISYQCVICHLWCTHRTSLVVKRKTFFCFLVDVNNSIISYSYFIIIPLR